MIGLKEIKPHQSIEIDVKKLRDEQTPDFRGTTIPISATSGQIRWTLHQHEMRVMSDRNKLALAGRSEQIDTVKGLSSSYACQNCCGGGDVGGFCVSSAIIPLSQVRSVRV
jgi:hypothetical protein